MIKSLFISFFKVGLFTFGGGYGMLPMLEREIIENKKWASREEILDIYALAQTVPGVIAVNTATFIGQRQAGYAGALAATAGMILPSILVILGIASMLGRLWNNEIVIHAFTGIRAAIAGLLAATAVRIVKSSCKGSFAFAVMLSAAATATLFRGGAIWAIAAAFVLGFARHKLANHTEKRDGE